MTETESRGIGDELYSTLTSMVMPVAPGHQDGGFGYPMVDGMIYEKTGPDVAVRILEDSNSSGDTSEISGPLNTLAEIGSNLLLFCLIFGLSATVDMKNLVKQLHNKFAILTGCAMQFLVMPLLGFCTILALEKHGFSSNMGLTLLIVTASPGGSYSNWWCSLFNAGEFGLIIVFIDPVTSFVIQSFSQRPLLSYPNPFHVLYR